jgi:glutamate racemase
MGRDVVLVDSADETAFSVRAMLARDDLQGPDARSGRHSWFSSGDVDTFRRLGSRLLGPELDRVGRLMWD